MNDERRLNHYQAEGFDDREPHLLWWCGLCGERWPCSGFEIDRTNRYWVNLEPIDGDASGAVFVAIGESNPKRVYITISDSDPYVSFTRGFGERLIAEIQKAIALVEE